MKVIPVGLDLAHLEQSLSTEEHQNLRKKFGFSEKDILIVSICRLSEEKNVSESINHFNVLSKLRHNVRLLIVGDGTARNNLENQVQELGLANIVKFAGNIPMEDVWKYYHIGDIFISSSLSEIQGLTYIEALASGLPIVCRKDDALNESLVEGINGFGFNNEEEFISAILPLVDNATFRYMIGSNAHASVGKYSLPVFADNLIGIYTKVLNERETELEYSE